MNQIKRVASIVGWAGLVSLFSLLASWAAIAFLLQHNIKWTIVCSVAAFSLDSLDGFVARKLGKASDFGRQLDSMVDAINYSVLAALVTSQVLLPNLLGFFVAFIILAFGVLRLTLFNIDGYASAGSNLYYTGVVTPHLTLATAIIFFVNRVFELNSILIAVVLTVLAVAQISTVRTRKTGALAFWLPASTAIAVGALIWL